MFENMVSQIFSEGKVAVIQHTETGIQRTVSYPLAAELIKGESPKWIVVIKHLPAIKITYNGATHYVPLAIADQETLIKTME